MKQLQPTTIDEYIAEHQAGETVTGRIVDAGHGQAKVELGEGVFAHCRFPDEIPEAVPEPSQSADLSSLTAMLSAKWKQGASSSKSSRPEAARAGQIRSFRIVKLDQANKKIDVELAG